MSTARCGSRAGNFHGDALRVIEYHAAISPDHLDCQVTIGDPTVFTRSWTMSWSLYRRVEEHARSLEFGCVEFVEELVYGRLRKCPGK